VNDPRIGTTAVMGGTIVSKGEIESVGRQQIRGED
jgi:hypothetical protein